MKLKLTRMKIDEQSLKSPPELDKKVENTVLQIVEGKARKNHGARLNLVV